MVLVKLTVQLKQKTTCRILVIKLRRGIDFVLSKHGRLEPTTLTVVTRVSLSLARNRALKKSRLVVPRFLVKVNVLVHHSLIDSLAKEMLSPQ